MARRTRNPFTQVFNSYTYWRNARGYYERRSGRKAVLIHRAVWEHLRGPIPPGYDVHHINGDRADNAVANLELQEHAAHAKHHWEDAEERVFICSWCGCSYASRSRIADKYHKYCSLKCHIQWRRDAGVDDEQRTCVICGKPYWVRRDMPTKTCSRSCGRALGAQTLRQKKAP